MANISILTTATWQYVDAFEHYSSKRITKQRNKLLHDLLSFMILCEGKYMYQRRPSCHSLSGKLWRDPLFSGPNSVLSYKL